MLRRFLLAFTHPAAGPVGFVLSIVMCALLVATSLSATRTEAQLRARITQLAQEDARTGALLRAKLVACEATPPGPMAPVEHLTNTSVAARADRLGREPQGFDVCARMESADRAVLETLR